MRYAIETIQLFVRLCKTKRVDHLITVATAAARQASNRKVFMDRIKQETNLDFKVLSGEEEAYYGYLGTVNTMPQTSGLMADLGGGSLKLVSFVDRMMENSHHLPFGSVTLANHYKIMDRPDPKSLEELEGSHQHLPLAAVASGQPPDYRCRRHIPFAGPGGPQVERICRILPTLTSLITKT